MRGFTKVATLAAAVSLFCPVHAFAGTAPGDVPLEDVTIRIIYDNVTSADGFTAHWGFACVIEGFPKTILFDTGMRGDLLMRNLETAGIDPSRIDVVVLSHEHGDHVGGLGSFLDANPGVTVWAPASFSAEFNERVAECCDSIVEVTDPPEVVPGVRTTGDMNGPVREQSLVLRTSEGIIVITGCAHPGIDRIVERAVEVSRGKPLLVMGGFHLPEAGRRRLEEIAAAFDGAGVRFCGASHCTGDGSMAFFRGRYGDRYVPLGAGTVIRGADLAGK